MDRRALIVSHRFDGFDGISVESDKWRRGLEQLGWSVTRAAGRFGRGPGARDVIVRGLWSEVFGEPPPPVDTDTVNVLVADADLVILDNIGTLWTLPLAAAAFEEAILRAGVPAILRHSDPPWQTPHEPTDAEHVLPLHDPRMLHVTINERTAAEFRARFPGIAGPGQVLTRYCTVDTESVQGGDRAGTRARFGVPDHEILVVHPARNVARKNVPAGLASAATLAVRVDVPVHYWLTDPGGPSLPDAPGVTVHRGWCEEPANLYAAADLLMLPSTWEGWGLPVLEAAAAAVPVAAGPYPVLDEIRALGLTVLDPGNTDALVRILTSTTDHSEMVKHNRTVARGLSIGTVPAVLVDLIERARAAAAT